MSEFPSTYLDEFIDEVSVWGGKRKGRSDCLDSLTAYNSITQPSTWCERSLSIEMCRLHVLCSTRYQPAGLGFVGKGYHFVVLPSKLEAERRMGDLCKGIGTTYGGGFSAIGRRSRPGTFRCMSCCCGESSDWWKGPVCDRWNRHRHQAQPGARKGCHLMRSG